MLIQYLLLAFYASWLAAAKPQSTGVSSAVPQTTACGDIIRKTNYTDLAHYHPFFDASDVFACLSSVPFNSAVASRFVKYFNDTIQFQSTLAYLKDPPRGYQQPAVDLVHELGLIQENIDNKQYRNQYHFEKAVQRVIYSAHDKHIQLNAGILSAFRFRSPWSIVSLSSDGREAPQLYLLGQANTSFHSRNTADDSNLSPIKTINGQDTGEYLTRIAQLHSPGNVDPHADWNALMYSPAQRIQSDVELFRHFVLYPGDTITLVLENGTTLGPEPFRALYLNPGPTGPLETGGDFYNFFVLGFYPAGFYQAEIAPVISAQETRTASASDTATRSVSTDPTVASTPLPTGWFDLEPSYPKPNLLQARFGREYGSWISGYFIDGSDITVLSIPSFLAKGHATSSFTSAVDQFISSSLEVGKTKLVIDLRQNGGGSVTLAVDTFRRFFPNVDPYMGTRMRAQGMANELGRLTTEFWDKQESIDTDLDAEVAEYVFSSSEWLATNRINPETNENFTTWREFYGPKHVHGDDFTNTQRYNYSNLFFVTDSLSFPETGYIVYGYNGNPADRKRSFAAENITILTDGLCDSACALFVEMMRHEAGVKTVAAGGRPGPGPMQATGGTRGASEYSIITLDLDIVRAKCIATKLSEKTTSFPERINNLYMLSGGINVRDAVRKGEEVPLQFRYDAADCRIYYTQDTLFNQTALWIHVVKAIQSPESFCVVNSTGNHTLDPPEPVTMQSDESPSNLLDNSFVDEELGDWIVGLGDGGMQSRDGAENSVAVAGQGCDGEDDVCKFPEHYKCVHVPDCDRYLHLSKKFVCVPRCVIGGEHCRATDQITGRCLEGSGDARLGYCQPNPCGICGCD